MVVHSGRRVYDDLVLAEHLILDQLAIYAQSVHEHAVQEYCAVKPGLVL